MGTIGQLQCTHLAFARNQNSLTYIVLGVNSRKPSYKPSVTVPPTLANAICGPVHFLLYYSYSLNKVEVVVVVVVVVEVEALKEACLCFL